MDDAKTPSSKRNEVARSKEKQARLDRLCKREPYPILLCPDPQPPWKTIEEIRNASKSVLDALSARVRSQHEVKYTLLIALDLWEATRSFSIPQNCPDIRAIRKYRDAVDLPKDALGCVEGVLEAILSRAEAEGEAQAEAGDQKKINPVPKASSGTTSPGSARLKIVAAITKHHEYATDSCLNTEPIGGNALAKLAEVGAGSVTNFFAKNFGSHVKYTHVCQAPATLATYLKAINAGFSPWTTFGEVPGESDHDDE